MCRHKEKLLLTIPAPCDVIQRNPGLRKLNCGGFRVPSSRHPSSKYQVNQSIGSIHWMTSRAQRIHNLATVQRDLKPLESKAFTGTLRSHQDCEISERELYVGKMREISNLKRYGALALGRGQGRCCPLVAHLMVLFANSPRMGIAQAVLTEAWPRLGIKAIAGRCLGNCCSRSRFDIGNCYPRIVNTVGGVSGSGSDACPVGAS